MPAGDAPPPVNRTTRSPRGAPCVALSLNVICEADAAKSVSVTVGSGVALNITWAAVYAPRLEPDTVNETLLAPGLILNGSKPVIFADPCPLTWKIAPV